MTSPRGHSTHTQHWDRDEKCTVISNGVGKVTWGLTRLRSILGNRTRWLTLAVVLEKMRDG